MLYLQWLYVLVNAHLCVFKLEASKMYEPHNIVTSAILAVQRAVLQWDVHRLCAGVHTSIERYNSECNNILNEIIYGNINVCQSCELVTLRLKQCRLKIHILKQHICTLTKLLTLILILIMGIEYFKPGTDMYYFE